jgi:hypothetical protein
VALELAEHGCGESDQGQVPWSGVSRDLQLTCCVVRL